MTSTMMMTTTIVPMPMYISSSSFSSFFGVHACARRRSSGMRSAAGDLVEAVYDTRNVAEQLEQEGPQYLDAKAFADEDGEERKK
jgi:hypothetical protein